MVSPHDTTACTSTASDAEPRLRTLCYRYLFFGWLFRDVTRGNLFDRAAAWRHNLAQAHWLVVYLRRWLLLVVLFFTMGHVVEHGLGLSVWSALFYVPSAIGVAVNAVIGAAIAGFKVLPGPLS